MYGCAPVFLMIYFITGIVIDSAFVQFVNPCEFKMQKNKFIGIKTFKVFLCASLLVSATSLSACDASKNLLKADREGSLEVQDYKDALASRLPTPVEAQQHSTISVPELQPYIASGAQNVEPMPLVSLSVNQSIPLRDVLFELAQQAEYDLELDPNIRGSIIFTARNRPFDKVIKRISEIAGLRYKFEDDVLRVEVDNPYSQLYKIDYLSYVRTTSGGIRNDVNVVSGEGSDTGSNFEATSSSEINFWGELETNLEQILGGPTTGALKTSRDPRITVAEQNPEVQAVTADGAPAEAPQAVLNVESLPTDEAEDVETASAQTFTINRQAGLINVYASEHVHNKVKEYLDTVKRAVTSQVLIEAKILEVSLEDQFDTGVNWSSIDLFSGELALDFDGATAVTPNFTVGYTGNDVTALIDALQRFGTVKALASPRLTVLNNQSAVMNVANNRVFFEVDIDVSTDDDTGDRDVDIDADIRNVPEGVLVNVQPSIDLDSRQISLALRPTITRVIDEVPNPAIQFITAIEDIEGVESLVPELNVQEVDSVIQVNSGQPIVMGGLLQDRVEVGEENVPVLGEVPLLGAAFRNQNDRVLKTELVIFLKATILQSPSDSVHNTDKDVYRQFSGDRRPLRF